MHYPYGIAVVPLEYLTNSLSVAGYFLGVGSLGFYGFHAVQWFLDNGKRK